MPGSDVSSSVETDMENDSTMASDGEENHKNTTDQLLDNLKLPSTHYAQSQIGNQFNVFLFIQYVQMNSS